MSAEKPAAFARALVTLGLCGLAAGCALFGSDKEYEDSGVTRPLEVPPDLSARPPSERMAIPDSGGRVSAVQTARAEQDARKVDGKRRTPAGPKPDAAASASSPQSSAAAPGDETVLPRQTGVSLRHARGERWLEVEADPRQLWPQLQAFWRQADIPVATAEPDVGIIRTQWVEPRDELPGGASPQGLRERYRVRLESASDGGADIYLTQRMAARVDKPGEQGDADNRDGDDNAAIADSEAPPEAGNWEPHPADPEAEAEMLQRLMAYLGKGSPNERQAAATPASDGADRAATRLDVVAGVPVLLVRDEFPEVWTRAGVALDSAGLAVERGNREKGVYRFRYKPRPEDEKGFLAGLFGFFGNDDDEGLSDDKSYELHLLDQQGSVLITAHNDGSPGKLPSAAAEQILRRLQSSLQGSA